MINILIRCQECDKVIYGATPKIIQYWKDFDEATRAATAHAEKTGHQLAIVGVVTKNR